jgi:CheY-like chemotaxis protein
MNIVAVEDDYLQAEWLKETLERIFSECTVEVVPTESHFRDQIGRWEANPPNLFIVDVLLAWALPSRQIPEPPPEVEEGGFQRAGLRCQALLAKSPALRRVPVVFYTVLDRDVLERELPRWPGGVSFLKKGDSQDKLLDLVRQKTAKRHA